MFYRLRLSDSPCNFANLAVKELYCFRLWIIMITKHWIDLGETECQHENGGCPYLCLPRQNGGKICTCPDDSEGLEGCENEKDASLFIRWYFYTSCDSNFLLAFVYGYVEWSFLLATFLRYLRSRSFQKNFKLLVWLQSCPQKVATGIE